MIVDQSKRIEYWNHFVERFYVFGEGGGHGITGPRLRNIKPSIMADDRFWVDIVCRHNGTKKTPLEMQVWGADTYNHCRGNFWGMIHQTMVEKGIIKS